MSSRKTGTSGYSVVKVDLPEHNPHADPRPRSKSVMVTKRSSQSTPSRQSKGTNPTPAHPGDDAPEDEELLDTKYDGKKPSSTNRKAATLPAERPRKPKTEARYEEYESPAEDDLERRRLGKPQKQLFAVDEPEDEPEEEEDEDNRLVFGWVTPPKPPSPKPAPPQPRVRSNSEVKPAPPHPRKDDNKRPSGDARPKPHVHDHCDCHRNTHHHHGGHHHGHHHHDGHHNHHCCHDYGANSHPHYYPPHDWFAHMARHAYGPHNHYAYPLGRPMFANIPELPTLPAQCREPYPSLPVPPTALLRDLEAQLKLPADINPVVAIASAAPATLLDLQEALKQAQEKHTTTFMGLVPKVFNLTDADPVLRNLANVVQVRFAERRGEETVNRVHLVPRGRLALGTIMASHPTLDFDLVFPSDFILRRWNISPDEKDKDLQPQTIANALDLNPASIVQGEIDGVKLRPVIQAVWDQLDGRADGFIFPGGKDDAARYLPQGWCSLHKGDSEHKSRLRLVTSGAPKIYINIWIKVSLTLYGREMIVGVDQSSARSDGKFQMVKVIAASSASLSETPLSPAHRMAITILVWCMNCVKVPAGSDLAPRIRTSHFILALAALRKLNPADGLYIAPTDATAETFSLGEVFKTVCKILKYLARAYAPDQQVYIPGRKFPFPLSSCTPLDALYSQASAKGPLLVPPIVLLVEAMEKLLDVVDLALNGLGDPAKAAESGLKGMGSIAGSGGNADSATATNLNTTPGTTDTTSGGQGPTTGTLGTEMEKTPTTGGAGNTEGTTVSPAAARENTATEGGVGNLGGTVTQATPTTPANPAATAPAPPGSG